MELVSIRENEITVELRWEDVALLVHVCEHAKQHDAMGNANDWGMGIDYLEATIAFLQAAGMASWAQTVGEETYSLERFLDVVQLTPEEERRWRERCEAAQREAGIRPAATEAPPPAAD